MALSGLLSAMRELILVDEHFPPTVDERVSMFRERFPDLTPRELTDLAKLPPEKVKIYQGTIFRGEVSTLEAHFPISMALIKETWSRAYGERFDSVAFVRGMLANRAWKGHLTVGLCESFLAHLDADLPEIGALCPFLGEIATLEFQTLLISRALDDKLSARDSIAVDNLVSCTVSELMAMPYFVPTNAAFHFFCRDVLSYRVDYFQGGEKLPDQAPSVQDTWAIGARNSSLFVRWNSVSEALFRHLEQLKRGELSELLAFAQVYCDSRPELSEAEQFSGFLQLLVSLIRSGALVLPVDATNLE